MRCQLNGPLSTSIEVAWPFDYNDSINENEKARSWSKFKVRIQMYWFHLAWMPRMYLPKYTGSNVLVILLAYLSRTQTVFSISPQSSPVHIHSGDFRHSFIALLGTLSRCSIMRMGSYIILLGIIMPPFCPGFKNQRASRPLSPSIQHFSHHDGLLQV
ncbi:hypothetical protein ACRALDRAFT_2015882 [Sodiomyces alcalophilus JCM 7366]|uniref:uncharacterized protein n=1 Tax=Sodiomyces alcalophilus JCM 7366 TaxID=591952 RepID=UPI0039B50EB9